jgi:hypothetical protein
VVVADEAHSMQAMAAQRTQRALRLMLDPRCAGVLLLTGTPLKNGTPANLFPLLRAVGHPLAASQRDYEAHFCDGRYHSYGGRQPVWKAAGARNLDQLRELSSSHVLYLSKEDVLRGLPGQTRVRRRVPVSAQWRARHAKALQELSAAFYGSQQQGGGDGGVGGGGQKDDKVVLGALQRLRKVGSLAKADAAAQIASQVLEKEPAVVVFSSFVDVSSSIHAQLRSMGWEGELLTGETPPGKRQAMVDRFQRGESAAFCATFGAGGVGLTLTAACTIVLVDRPWTPGEAAQAEGNCCAALAGFRAPPFSERARSLPLSLSLSLLSSLPDRVRRIGQTKPVTSIWISAWDLDDQIDAMLEQKKLNAAAVLEERQAAASPGREKPSSSSLSADPVAKLSIFRMLRTVLPPHRSGGTAAASSSSSSQPSLKQTSILQFSQSKT